MAFRGQCPGRLCERSEKRPIASILNQQMEIQCKNEGHGGSYPRFSHARLESTRVSANFLQRLCTPSDVGLALLPYSAETGWGCSLLFRLHCLNALVLLIKLGESQPRRRIFFRMVLRFSMSRESNLPNCLTMSCFPTVACLPSLTYDSARSPHFRHSTSF